MANDPRADRSCYNRNCRQHNLQPGNGASSVYSKDSIDNITRVHCPVLVIHGTSDHTIPFSHGLALYNAAPNPKRCLWVKNADHNDLPDIAGPRYPHALHDFTGLLSK